ncbi:MULTISPECIES: tripartite tricarboxylate transporter substrate-binding protein [unclassified Cupriavidus]|uniref:tripartite tricarboxylate transporter substrate-binding protein n=1 Tax=unclassified Cupriavidus TaxID=2640874 RepID=UPI002330B406|nr:MULTISPECIES: tripartite tricarboxylate transporter substrate-binding protein [unclassified Cupriavidus]
MSTYIASAGRWGEIPDVPTTAQAGIADYLVASWIGALAPVSTPAPVVERLSDELVRNARTWHAAPASTNTCSVLPSRKVTVTSATNLPG